MLPSTGHVEYLRRYEETRTTALAGKGYAGTCYMNWKQRIRFLGDRVGFKWVKTLRRNLRQITLGYLASSGRA